MRWTRRPVDSWGSGSGDLASTGKRSHYIGIDIPFHPAFGTPNPEPGIRFGATRKTSPAQR